MNDKVYVYVLLAATRRTYEFRVSYDLTVCQVAELMARILAGRERLRYVAGTTTDLMYVDGPRAGALLDGQETVRSLVLKEELVNGQTLALA